MPFRGAELVGAYKLIYRKWNIWVRESHEPSRDEPCLAASNLARGGSVDSPTAKFRLTASVVESSAGGQNAVIRAVIAPVKGQRKRTRRYIARWEQRARKGKGRGRRRRRNQPRYRGNHGNYSRACSLQWRSVRERGEKKERLGAARFPPRLVRHCVLYPISFLVR